MPAIFSKNKDLRMRHRILRGVYEENLRIVGRKTDLVRTHRFPMTRKLFLSFLGGLIIVLGSGIASPLFQHKQMSAGLISQRPAPRPVEDTASSADYRNFIVNDDVPVSRMFGLGVRTIMIDPGHGGADSGTIGKLGTKEKDITLDIARRLAGRLNKYGRFNVVMTRDGDTTVPLNKRVETASAAKADLFISVHINYLPKRPINMIETYYFGPSSDSKILGLAEQENAGSQYGLGEFKEIIEKLGDKLKLQESKEFAASIQKKLFQNMKQEAGNTYDFGVKRAPFVVLLGVDVPAVLAEVSCMSNREEEVQLSRESHRENIARYLEAGILDYLKKGEPIYGAN